MTDQKEQLKREIVVALAQAGGRVSGPNDTAIRETLALSCSTTRFSDALGSLIQAGAVRRSRPAMVGISFPDERLITLTLVAR